MPTSLNPFCSNRLMISPTSPLCTPSGLMAMKVRSWLPAIGLKHSEVKLIPNALAVSSVEAGAEASHHSQVK